MMPDEDAPDESPMILGEDEQEASVKWDAMNSLLREVVNVPKEQYDRREAVYKQSRKGKMRGERNALSVSIVDETRDS